MLVYLLSPNAKDKKVGNTSKLLEPPKARGYQVDAERCLWQRFELWYGNNPRDDASFEQKLKWATSSQGPNPVNDEGTEKVQRLNASGLESANHRR